MDGPKLLLFAALTIGLFRGSYSQTCAKKCPSGRYCRVFKLRCRTEPCRSFEYCSTVPPPETTKPQNPAPARSPSRTASRPRSSGSQLIQLNGVNVGFSLDCKTKQCPEWEHCVMEGRSCVALPCRPIPVCKRTQRPGSCPAVSIPRGETNCTSECSHDNQCSSNKKCCMEGCRKACMTPQDIQLDSPKADSGFCPNFPNVTLSDCTSECTNDDACEPGRKCCKYGCSMRCVKKLNTQNPEEKPDFCPWIQTESNDNQCAINCATDNDCNSTRKCCLMGCTMSCEAPLATDPNRQGTGRGGARTEGASEPQTDESEPAPFQRPGVCPFMSRSTTKCSDACVEDNDCPRQMKCCIATCGKRCLNVAVPGFGRDCGRDACTSDASCPGSQVCRNNGCRRTCQAASQSSGSKSGSCPNFPSTFVVSHCITNCKSDQDCTGNKKCCDYGSCKRCLMPSGSVFRAAARPSQCPDMPATSNMTSCEPLCSSDRTCRGGQVCCPYGCSTKCLDPVTTTPILKPGFCPATPPSVRTFACYKACTGDDACPGNTKCCGSGCNTRCVPRRTTAPKASRPGSCPANDINSPTTDCYSKCSDDFACVQNEKCCFNGCRRECVAAVRSVAPRKPGFCPLQSPARITNYLSFLRQDCGHFCNSDFSCPGELKCCKQGCKTSCIARQSLPAATVKEGYCPATTESFGECERTCNSDTSCGGSQKCCFEGTCSQKCVNPTSTPPTPRPGVCPNVPQLPADQCLSSTEYCNSDHACPEPLKCCFDGCNNRCINPESSAMSTKEGFCPSFSLNTSSACVVECSSDDVCPGDQKCCSEGCAVKCVQPKQTPPKDKAGFCPFIPTSLSSSCQQSCQLDDSCPGIMKCCQNGCSRKCYNPVAMPPAMSKAGYCPASASVSNPTCNEPCTSDGSCEGNKKCCQLSCGMTCVEPDTNHPGVKLGFCPFVSPNVSTMCLKTCSSDYACAGDTKCCSFGQCSMRCMAPETAPQAQRKPGDCPSAGDAQGLPESIQCLSDYSCSGDQKCCRIGNNVQCVAPAQESEMKIGTCPVITNTSPVCIKRCSSDSNCPDNEKCCASGCSSFCSAPTFADAPRTSPGYCPYVQPQVLLPCNINCTNDDGCGENMKCCEYGCGMRCLNSQPFPPTTQKDGNCPSPRVLNPLYSVPGGRFWFITREAPSRETYGYRNCGNDGQCPGTLKCCASSVGGTECITPI